MPRQARLTRGAEIRRAFRRGERRRAGPTDLFLSPSPADRPRVAVVVPRHGRSVAERNRLKRRLREIARRELLPRALASGSRHDLVLRARPTAYGRPYRELRQAILSAYRPEEGPCSDV